MNAHEPGFPWGIVMQFGLGVLRLPPQQFWSLSVPELKAAMAAHYLQVPTALSRAELDQLMRDHPDQHRQDG